MAVKSAPADGEMEALLVARPPGTSLSVLLFSGFCAFFLFRRVSRGRHPIDMLLFTVSFVGRCGALACLVPDLMDGPQHLARGFSALPVPCVRLHHWLFVTRLRGWFTCFSYSFSLFIGLEFIHQLCSFVIILKGLP